MYSLFLYTHVYRSQCLAAMLLKRSFVNSPNQRTFLAPANGIKHMSTSISQQFDEAQKRLQTLKTSPGNEAKLKLYGLFKQATAGAVNTKRPGMTDFVGKAKWDAWNSLGSMSQVRFIVFVFNTYIS